MIQALLPLLGPLLDKILPDPKAAAEAKLRALEMAQRGELAVLDADVKLALGQLDINKAEATTDLFRGGWRPMVGWTCAGGLFYQVIARPLLGWIALNWLGWTVLPALEMETLMTLLFGMLGLGGYRTFERIKGKA